MARRRAFIRALIGGAAALALALGGVTAAAAVEPSGETGSISGTVIRDDDGLPVAGVTVSVYGPTWASDVTDSTGSYTLPNLAAGSYIVSFFPDGTDLKRAYWEGTDDYSLATPVVVGDGEAVSAINASLVQGGAIQGTVTREEDGSGIDGAEVQALDSHNEIVAATTADASGEYTLGGLPTGSYRVRFASADAELLAEYWEGAYEWDTAKYVAVVEKETVTGIDASLVVAGYISGTVTGGVDGQPLSAMVIAYGVDESHDMPSVNTDFDGSYRVAVAPGTYKVRFLSRGLVEEYWEDAADWDAAKTITVTARQEVVGVDATLEPGATITGTVTIDSAETSKLWVGIWSDGKVDRWASTDPVTGEYNLSVRRGTYVLVAKAEFTNGTTTAEPQYFDGVATAAEATPISVVPSQVVTDIDFALSVDTEPEPEPVLSLAVGSIRAGKDIAISGAGFAPGAAITFELHSSPIALGTLTADRNGALQGTLRIPASAPAGAHTLVALSGTTVLARTALTVTAAAGTGGQAGGGVEAPGGNGAGSRGQLASTGADAPVAMVTIGLFLAVLGGLLVRRRRVEG